MISQTLWILIASQIAMGAFDTLFHHELTERLAWRPSQQRELQLHGVRDLLYAVLFVTLGWAEVHGVLAMIVIAILGVELIITLMDFVEEDMSRSLPPSERINHTLLALNYGAILALLVPVLMAWMEQPTAIRPTSHGWWSALATLAAAGVGLFGLRDLAASRRVGRLAPGDAAALVADIGARKTILVTGATGFIGQRLVSVLIAANHDVIALVRDPGKIVHLGLPIRLVTDFDQIPSHTSIDAIVNLAGEPLGNGFWTAAKRRRMVESRVAMTSNLVTLIGRLTTRPSVMINGSAIGWYGLWEDQQLTEIAAPRACFSHELCDSWESKAVWATALGVRVVLLRIGLVLGTDGGFLTRMLTPFEFGLGGPFGSGRQWMSWIERDDLIRLIAHAIARSDVTGPLNATAPAPVTNADFVSTLAQSLHRPAILRVPSAVLHWIGGQFADELLIGGQRVIPAKALASGFVFRHERLCDALDAVLGNAEPKQARGSLRGSRRKSLQAWFSLMRFD
jgi:uncharacterized protein (TIGR01777 family)